MKPNSLMKSSPVLLELGSSFLRVQREEEVLELPLDRGPDGLLSLDCVANLTARLPDFLGSNARGRRRKAWCAVGARGVSLRRLSLPVNARDRVPQLLAMQIESEFPLPPLELAWGYTEISASGQGSSTRDYLVAALKKKTLEQVETIFAAAGLETVYTLSAVALGQVVPSASHDCAVLKVGEQDSEWTILEGGLPTSVRMVAWGEAQLLDALAGQMNVSREKAKEALVSSPAGSELNEARAPMIQQAVRETLGPVLPSLLDGWSGRHIFVTGSIEMLPPLMKHLAEFTIGSVHWQELESPAESIESPVLRGLQLCAHSPERSLPLTLAWQDEDHDSRPRPASNFYKWMAVAALLLLGLFSIRYVEPMVRQARLEQVIREMETTWEQRPDIDRELAFLQYLQTNQPPFLNVISIMADAAGRGTKFDSLSVNRRGDMSLKGMMPDPKLAGEFRAQLIDSGWFSAVVLEEQTPIPNQKKVNVRLNGRWKMVPSANPPPSSQPTSTTEENPAEESEDTETSP